MALSSNPEARANQLANLRPVSRDPALASAMGKANGFGSGKLPQCGAIKRDGARCNKPTAYGTSRCITHGARRRAGKPSPWGEVRAARDLLEQNPAPPELLRHPAWIDADKGEARARFPRLVALRVAWDAAQNGNPEQWRNLIQT